MTKTITLASRRSKRTINLTVGADSLSPTNILDIAEFKQLLEEAFEDLEVLQARLEKEQQTLQAAPGGMAGWFNALAEKGHVPLTPSWEPDNYGVLKFSLTPDMPWDDDAEILAFHSLWRRHDHVLLNALLDSRWKEWEQLAMKTAAAEILKYLQSPIEGRVPPYLEAAVTSASTTLMYWNVLANHPDWKTNSTEAKHIALAKQWQELGLIE